MRYILLGDTLQNTHTHTPPTTTVCLFKCVCVCVLCWLLCVIRQWRNSTLGVSVDHPQIAHCVYHSRQPSLSPTATTTTTATTTIQCVLNICALTLLGPLVRLKSYQELCVMSSLALAFLFCVCIYLFLPCAHTSLLLWAFSYVWSFKCANKTSSCVWCFWPTRFAHTNTTRICMSSSTRLVPSILLPLYCHPTPPSRTTTNFGIVFLHLAAAAMRGRYGGVSVGRWTQNVFHTLLPHNVYSYIVCILYSYFSDKHFLVFIAGLQYNRQ